MNKNKIRIFLGVVAVPSSVWAAELNAADTAWVLTSTALVLFMTLPGLALFYGGLVRTRNVLSVLMQCFSIAAVVSVLWLAVGYSLAFSDGGAAQAVLGGGGAPLPPVWDLMICQAPFPRWSFSLFR